MALKRSVQKVIPISILATAAVVVIMSLDISPDHAPIETIPNIAPEPDAVPGTELESESETEPITIDLIDIISVPGVEIPDPILTIPDIQE